MFAHTVRGHVDLFFSLSSFVTDVISAWLFFTEEDEEEDDLLIDWLSNEWRVGRLPRFRFQFDLADLINIYYCPTDLSNEY